MGGGVKGRVLLERDLVMCIFKQTASEYPILRVFLMGVTIKMYAVNFRLECALTPSWIGMYSPYVECFSFCLPCPPPPHLIQLLLEGIV